MTTGTVSLDEIVRDPAKGASLPAITRAGLLAQCAVVMATLAASMVASKDVHKPAQDVSLDVMTTKQLAEMWEMPEAKIRDLCRTGRLPAKKLGTKGVGNREGRAPRLVALGPPFANR